MSHSEQQARAQVESIKAMVRALECDWDRLEELRDMGEDIDPDEVGELTALETMAGDCADRDDAETRIAEDPLSVLVRDGWREPGSDSDGPEEFEILLCTGGPAVRLVGKLSDGEPETARVEHQDWGTPWTELPVDRKTEEELLTYCRQFYFAD